MEKNPRTFAHNWYDRNSDIFQLVISHEINKAFDGDIPKETPVYKHDINDHEAMYFVDGHDVVKVKYNPEKSIHTLYVKQERSNKPNARRSKDIHSGYTLPTARG